PTTSNIGILKQVFPGVLVSFLNMVYAIQADLANKDFSPFKAEAVSFIERLALYGLTGDPRVIPTRLWNTLGTREALVRRGWPFVRPRYLDFVNTKIGAQGWPRFILEPLLHTKPGIIYNYDRATFLRLRNYMVEREFGQHMYPSLVAVQRSLSDVIRLMKEEVLVWVKSMLLVMHADATVPEIVRNFMTNENPLSNVTLYTEAVKSVTAISRSTSYDVGEFARHLYDTVTREELPLSNKIPLLPSQTWHESLRLVLTCPDDSLFIGNSRQNKMVTMLTIALTSEEVSCLPGRHEKSGKLTISHIVHLYSKSQARAKRREIRGSEGSLPALGLSVTVSELPSWMIESIQDWRIYIDPAVNNRIPKNITSDVISSFRILLDITLTVDLAADPFLRMVVVYAAVYRMMTFPPLFDLSNDMVK
ncbi:hypothetical protein V1505DRAFT_359408, partial [Lipomyces doorenjongii]